MTTTAKPLFVAKYAENAITQQYPCPASARTIIDKFTGTNTSAAVATLSVYIVPSSGSAGASNQITVTKSLAVGEVYTFPEIVGQVLSGGEFISTLASAASAIVIRASGREIT